MNWFNSLSPPRCYSNSRWVIPNTYHGFSWWAIYDTCWIALSWIPQNTFDSNSTLSQLMAWCLTANKSSPKPILTQICVGIWRHKTTLSYSIATCLVGIKPLLKPDVLDTILTLLLKFTIIQLILSANSSASGKIEWHFRQVIFFSIPLNELTHVSFSFFPNRQNFVCKNDNRNNSMMPWLHLFGKQCIHIVISSAESVTVFTLIGWLPVGTAFGKYSPTHHYWKS